MRARITIGLVDTPESAEQERLDPTGVPSSMTSHLAMAAVAAAIAAFGCGSPTEPAKSAARLTARPGTPTETPPLGLSALDVDGGPDGNLYVPTGYNPGTPLPLFIGLHGAGGDADNWASYPDRAESRQMVFLAIDSDGYTWDLIDRGGFGPDVTRLDRALAWVFERVAIDPAHITLAGFSDGGSYALSLGVSNGDLFTHLIGYSPGFLASAPPTVGMPRIFISHGTQDPILPIDVSYQATVRLLEDAGYDVTYLEFDGGHEVPANISETALDWFLNQP